MAGWTRDNGDRSGLQSPLMAEINITPMVDVMLVLLVIFMVTAPLLVAGVPVELPQTSAQRIAQPRKPLIVTLALDGSLHVRDEEVEKTSLLTALGDIRQAEGDAIVYIRADRKIPYGDVMTLIGSLGKAGYPHISLLSQAAAAPETSPPPAPAAP